MNNTVLEQNFYKFNFKRTFSFFCQSVLSEGINEPMEVLEIIMELWGRCEKNEDIRAIGVSLGEFRKSKVKQIALGEDYDMEKKTKVANLKEEIRSR